MCAAAHDLAPMLNARMGVAVADHNARWVEPLVFKNRELRQANITLHRVGGDRRAGAQRGSGGGNGYTYLQKSFLPRLVEAGVNAATIKTITVENPARLLTLRKPA